MRPELSIRLLMVAAGLFGAIGIAVAAMAAHGNSNEGNSSELLRTASLFLMIHGAAVAAAAALRARWAGGAMIAGTLLFCGDLMARAWLGQGIFPMAAPAGGSILIAAWLLLALSGLARRK